MGLIKNIKRKIKQIKNPTPFFTEENVNSLLEIALSKIDFPSEKLTKYNKKDVYYYLFENVFYNHETVIKIQKNYLKYVPKNSKNNFLDIGCGRGEFLDLLKLENIKAKGIEINDFEADLLKEKGYSAENNDAISYLKSSNEIFSGISAIQVAEHLEFNYLYEFIHEAFNKIETGGVLILETLNPMLLDNVKLFNTDLTHVRPIPPNSLIFLCEYAGFKDIKICKSLPNRDDEYVNYALIYYKK